MSWYVSAHSFCASRKIVGESDQLQELVGGNVEIVAHDDLVHTSNEYGALTNEKVVSAWCLVSNEEGHFDIELICCLLRLRPESGKRHTWRAKRETFAPME